MHPDMAEAEGEPQSNKKSWFQRWKENPSMWLSPAWFTDWKNSMKSAYKFWTYTKREGAIYMFSSICSDAKYAVAAAAYWLNSVGFFTWGKTIALKLASWVVAAFATAAALLQP